MLSTQKKDANSAQNEIITLPIKVIRVSDEETGELTEVYISGNSNDENFTPAIFDAEMWQDTGNILSIYNLQLEKQFVGWYVSEALTDDGKPLLKLKKGGGYFNTHLVQQYGTNSLYLIPQWDSLKSLPTFENELVGLKYEGCSKDAEGKPRFHSVRILKFKGKVTNPNIEKDEIEEKPKKQNNATKLKKSK